MAEHDPWRHPTEPDPHELHRWEDEGGRVLGEPVQPDNGPKGRGVSVLRMLAVILILLALLGGGVGLAMNVAVELLWICLVVLLIGCLLGGFDYWGRPGPPPLV